MPKPWLYPHIGNIRIVQCSKRPLLRESLEMKSQYYNNFTERYNLSFGYR